MKTDPSRDQLTMSMDRRLRHLMIRTLEKFERAFPGLQDQQNTQVFKGDIRTIFNDVLRAQRDELRDYQVDYRPLKLTDDNVLAMTRTFMETVQKIEFSLTNGPSIRIYAGKEKSGVLDAIRAEFGTGVLYLVGESMVLEIVGTQSCVDCVLPIMDRYRLHESKRAEYLTWRQEVVRAYRSKV